VRNGLASIGSIRSQLAYADCYKPEAQRGRQACSRTCLRRWAPFRDVPVAQKPRPPVVLEWDYERRAGKEFSETPKKIDLSSIEWSVAGPMAPQDLDDAVLDR
jgi:hypothetical protein